MCWDSINLGVPSNLAAFHFLSRVNDHKRVVMILSIGIDIGDNAPSSLYNFFHSFQFLIVISFCFLSTRLIHMSEKSSIFLLPRIHIYQTCQYTVVAFGINFHVLQFMYLLPFFRVWDPSRPPQAPNFP